MGPVDANEWNDHHRSRRFRVSRESREIRGRLTQPDRGNRPAIRRGSEKDRLNGHSNGGYLSFHTACENADLIAAIVSLFPGIDEGARMFKMA
jgi:hypothetical protein